MVGSVYMWPPPGAPRPCCCSYMLLTGGLVGVGAGEGEGECWRMAFEKGRSEGAAGWGCAVGLGEGGRRW